MNYDTLDLNILKAILNNKIYGLEFAHLHDASLFSDNVKLFGKLIVDYMRAYRSLPTRRTLLERHGHHENISAAINNIWDAVDGHVYNEVEYAFDLEKLKNRYESWMLNRIKENLFKNDKSNSEITKEIALTVQHIQSIKNGRAYIHRTVKEHVPRFKERYIARLQSPDTTELVKTGYAGIDYATDGLLPAEMVIIGGETNAGKSMFLSNLAIQMWMQQNTTYTENFNKGYNILYLSLEMPYDDCFARFLARVADVPQRSILRGLLDDDERERVAQAERFIESYPFEFDIVDIPRDLTIQELELRYNDAILRYKPDIVVVDYLSLMDDRKHAKEQDWLRLGNLAAQLHEFARAYNVIMLTAVQLTDIRRGSKGDVSKKSEDQTVGVHRVGRSSLIMHHANLGIQIEKRPGEERFSDLKYHIIKNRKGPLIRGMLTKNFANGALFDKSFISNEQASGTSMEDIHDKIKKLKDSGDEENGTE